MPCLRRKSIVSSESFKASAEYALRLAKKNYELELTTIEKYYEAQAQYQEAKKDVLESKQKYDEAMAYLNQYAQTDIKSIEPLKPDVLLYLPAPQRKDFWIRQAVFEKY